MFTLFQVVFLVFVDVVVVFEVVAPFTRCAAEHLNMHSQWDLIYKLNRTLTRNSVVDASRCCRRCRLATFPCQSVANKKAKRLGKFNRKQNYLSTHTQFTANHQAFVGALVTTTTTTMWLLTKTNHCNSKIELQLSKASEWTQKKLSGQQIGAMSESMMTIVRVQIQTCNLTAEVLSRGSTIFRH